MDWNNNEAVVICTKEETIFLIKKLSKNNNFALRIIKNTNNEYDISLSKCDNIFHIYYHSEHIKYNYINYAINYITNHLTVNNTISIYCDSKLIFSVEYKNIKNIELIKNLLICDMFTLRFIGSADYKLFNNCIATIVKYNNIYTLCIDKIYKISNNVYELITLVCNVINIDIRYVELDCSSNIKINIVEE